MIKEIKFQDELVHQKEKNYFILTLVFSILTYIVLLFSIIGIVIVGFLLGFSYFFHALSMASIRRNGVRISEEQFPAIYEKAKMLAAKMDLDEMPNIYVIESSGFLNAFATRFFGKNMVVIYSEIFDLSEENREDELLFVLAHELAHLKRRHVLVSFFLLPAMYVPFLGEAYLRGCEYTCDRYAAYYVGNFPAAKEALTMLAIGKHLSSKVNQEAYVQQIKEESGFFAWLSEKLSSHPHLPKRINALDHWVHPEQYPLIPEKKNKVVIGILATSALCVVATGVIMGIIFGSSILAASLEEDYVETETEVALTPLMVAAEEDNSDEILDLLIDGEYIEERDIEGFTALQYAVMWGNVDAAQTLLANGADANTLDNWDSTPLMNAVHYNSGTEMVELLLFHGADPAMKNSDGDTAYDLAAQYSDTALTDLLKDYSH